MPVVAIAGAIGGATALATGTLTVLQTIAAIGGIVSGIGAITGNKTLMKIGGVASLAGGIGAFAQSQGWLTTASAADTAAAATQTSAIDAMQAAPSGAEYNVGVDPSTANFGGAAGSNSLELGQVDIMEGAAQQATGGLAQAQSITDTISQASPELTKTMGAAPPGLMDAPALSPVGDMVGKPPTTAGSAPVDAVPPASQPSSATQAMGGQGPAVPPGLPNTYQNSGGKILDLFNKFFRDKDGKLNKEMLALTGNFVGGMFDDKKKAETELYEARAETERAQLANASAVPALNLRAQTKPGGTFRTTQPTYRPVRITGGLINAR